MHLKYLCFLLDFILIIFHSLFYLKSILFSFYFEFKSQLKLIIILIFMMTLKNFLSSQKNFFLFDFIFLFVDCLNLIFYFFFNFLKFILQACLITMILIQNYWKQNLKNHFYHYSISIFYLQRFKLIHHLFLQNYFYSNFLKVDAYQMNLRIFVIQISYQPYCSKSIQYLHFL